MADLLLIPGADGRAWSWHRLVPELAARGHRGIPVELPLEPAATLDDYRDAALAAVAAVPDPGRLTVVGQSLGAYTAPLLVDRLAVERIVLINPMIPAPGETAGEFWDATGQEQARVAAALKHGHPTEFDLLTGFFHDVPEDVTAEAMASGGVAELDGVFAQPWPLSRWPEVRTEVILAEGDRFFPLEFQRRVIAERLPDPALHVIPGGHLVALADPVTVADTLDVIVRSPTASEGAPRG
ncbi:alpha/beta hydrolase [Nakamurella sp. A5-74]|uniref:Alpha/beta hydrolase n=1 Tax=Nakamurella sp. A5-74 TaxID=3158264 RepID=A0AAU8DQV7_9ACTN